MREYSDRVALTLLRMHREKVAMAGEGIDGREHEEACARIIVRLERLKDREGAAGATARGGGVEVKCDGAWRTSVRAALARCAIIRGGLKAREYKPPESKVGA